MHEEALYYYNEYEFFPEVSYISQHGYITGFNDGKSWFAYFDRFGNLYKRDTDCDEVENVSIGKSITMSSQILGGAADHAIDGNICDEEDCYATSVSEYHPWLMIDLGAFHLIDSIRLSPRQDTLHPFTNTRMYMDWHPIPENVAEAHMTIEWQYGFYSNPLTEPFAIDIKNYAVSTRIPIRYLSLHKLGYGVLSISDSH